MAGQAHSRIVYDTRGGMAGGGGLGKWGGSGGGKGKDVIMILHAVMRGRIACYLGRVGFRAPQYRHCFKIAGVS